MDIYIYIYIYIYTDRMLCRQTITPIITITHICKESLCCYISLCYRIGATQLLAMAKDRFSAVYVLFRKGVNGSLDVRRHRVLVPECQDTIKSVLVKYAVNFSQFYDIYWKTWPLQGIWLILPFKSGVLIGHKIWTIKACGHTEMISIYYTYYCSLSTDYRCGI